MKSARTDPLLAFLVQTGRLVKLSDKVIVHRQHAEKAQQVLTELLAARGQIDPAAFKDALQTSRKYVIPLLEYFDAQGVSRPGGGVRKLAER